MEVAFEDPALQKLESDPAFTAGFEAAVVKAFRKRMQLIRAAVDERTFYAMKSLHYEKLKGNRAGQSSEEHTSELQSLMRTSYAVFVLQKKKLHSIKQLNR